MSVAAITVNWNRGALTLRCLDALRAGSQACHAYVVDNASTDGSLELFATLPGDATLIRNKVNRGWAGGNNVGLRRALADGHEFIFVLNNDAIVDPQTLEALIEVYPQGARDGILPVLGMPERHSDGSYGFVTAVDEPETGVPYWLGRTETKLTEALSSTVYVHGAAMFAHRSVFESVGYFDERFFLCFDDTDWCFRAAKKGHPLLVARDAAIDHDGSATMGGFDSPLTIYFMTRNRLLFAEQHCAAKQRAALAKTYEDYLRQIADKTGARAIAFKTAVADYSARRFGDCPAAMRAPVQRVTAGS